MGGGGCCLATLVWSNAIGIPPCLRFTILGSIIVLVLQARGFIVHSDNQILLEFLSLLKPLKSSIFYTKVTLSPVLSVFGISPLKSFQVIFLMYCRGVIKHFGI